MVSDFRHLQTKSTKFKKLMQPTFELTPDDPVVVYPCRLAPHQPTPKTGVISPKLPATGFELKCLTE